MDAGAWCAARLLAVGYRRCKWWTGAYGYYAGRGCFWSGGEDRDWTRIRVLSRFAKIEGSGKSASRVLDLDQKFAGTQVRLLVSTVQFIDNGTLLIMLADAHHDSFRKRTELSMRRIENAQRFSIDTLAAERRWSSAFHARSDDLVQNLVSVLN